MRSVVVVGICGASGCGKSTLAKQLAEAFDSPILPISVDTYFKRKKPLCCYGDHSKCSEMPESVDQMACARDLQQLVELLKTVDFMPQVALQKTCLDRAHRVGKSLGNTQVVLVVEGFVLFAELKLVELCDHLVWLDCDEETGCQRRFRRRMLKQQGQVDHDAELVKFRKVYSHVYRHHLDLRPTFFETMAGRCCIQLDSRSAPEEVYQQALRDLQAALISSTVQEVALSVQASHDAVEVCEAEVAPQQKLKPHVQKRWGRASGSISLSKNNSSKPTLPAGLEQFAPLMNLKVQVQWHTAEEDRSTEGILRQAQGRNSVKVITDEGLAVIIPASAVSFIEAFDGKASKLSSQVHDDHRHSSTGVTGDVPTGLARNGERQPYIFDMETGDPDDILTLLFLCSNPSVHLRAVTITPGSAEQVALVRWILNEVQMPGVRIGAQAWPTNASKQGCMKGRFYDNFGRLQEGLPICESADRVLLECCEDSVTLVTGAALHNLGAILNTDSFRLGRWVAQGGFAGEGVVPRHLQMDKFAGKVTCPTYNFNGNAAAATAALESPLIRRRLLVSKNVCHRAVYDEKWHLALGAVLTSIEKERKCQGGGASSRFVSLNLMHAAMDNYLRGRGEKKLHDPLALAAALDESVCQLAEVQVFRGQGGWGSRLSPGSGTWISIDYNPAKFQSVLLCDNLHI